jgi:hypothetical protein
MPPPPILQIRKPRPEKFNSPVPTCFSLAVDEIQSQACLDGSELGWLDVYLRLCDLGQILAPLGPQ